MVRICGGDGSDGGGDDGDGDDADDFGTPFKLAGTIVINIC